MSDRERPIRDDEAHEQCARLNRLARAFVRRVSRVDDPRQVEQLILDTMARAVRADVGALARFLPAEKALAIRATVGYPLSLVEHLRIRPGFGLIGRSFSRRRPLLIKDVAAFDSDTKRRLRYRTTSCILLPIRAADGVRAVVSLTDRHDNQPFDRADLRALRYLAGPAAIALSREELREELAEQTRIASVDALTGLFNRRYLTERLEAEAQRSRRHSDPLALLMLDIDNFKAVNDSLGHIEGDRILKEVAGILRSGVRIFDVCSRFGGEEFAILMPGSGADTACRIAERIRDQVQQRYASTSLPALRVSISIGVALLGPGMNSEDLIAKADTGLIAAKAAGKNSVRLAP